MTVIESQNIKIGDKVLRRKSSGEWVETTVNETYSILIKEFPEDYQLIGKSNKFSFEPIIASLKEMIKKEEVFIDNLKEIYSKKELSLRHNASVKLLVSNSLETSVSMLDFYKYRLNQYIQANNGICEE